MELSQNAKQNITVVLVPESNQIPGKKDIKPLNLWKK
jgi:hypothetical protein